MRLLYIFTAAFASTCLAEVVELTDSNFDTEFASGNWLVKFHAPWCGHCKTLAPVLDDLSNQEVGEVKIGSLDATKNSQTAKKYEVKRYPTIMYKKGDIVGKYDGARSLEALKTFTVRMNEPSYVNVNSVMEWETLAAQTDNVTFLLSYKSSMQSSLESVIGTFKKVADTLHTHASFALFDLDSQPDPSLYPSALVDTSSSHSTGYTIAKMEVGREPIMLNVPVDGAAVSAEALSEALSAFVEGNNYPTISKFDNHNFKRLSHLNKTMVIAVVDHRVEADAERLIAALTNTVKTYPVEATSKFIFGHLDGNRWRRFIKEHHAVLSSILVVDPHRDLHGNVPIDSAATLSATSVAIADVVSSVLDGSMELHPTVTPSLLQKIQYRMRDYYPWSYLVLAVPLLLALMSLFVRYPQDEKIKKH